MGSRTKKKGAARASAANNATGNMLNAQIAAARHFGNKQSASEEETNTSSSTWLTKMQSADPADREDGCIDLANLSRTATNLPILINSSAPQYLAAALVDDEMHVRTAAASATRNILLQLSVHNAGATDKNATTAAPTAESYITGDFCANLAAKLSVSFAHLVAADSHRMQSNGQPLTEAHLRTLAEGPAAAKPTTTNAAAVASLANTDMAAALNAAVTEAVLEEGDEGEVEAFETMRDAAFANVDEFIQLIGVVADCSEAATEYFSDVSKCSVLQILASAVEIGLDTSFAATLNQSRGMELFVTATATEASQIAAVAAETLHLISRDNAALGTFLATSLTPSQQALMNELTTNTPTSPSMLLISLHLVSALLNTSPTIANAQRSVNSVSRALSTLPFAEWKRVLPLLTEGCDMAEELRKASVRQTLDRFRALQLASDIFGEIIGVVCESHNDEDDDEAAFAKNPNAAVIMGSGDMVTNLIAILTDIFSPQDEVLQKALREVTDNTEVSAIQHAFAAVEVGIFGVVSSLLHLLPIEAMGPSDIVWRTCVSVLTARHELVSESIGCPEGPLPSLTQMILQIESLTEMCWTVLRKDSAKGNTVQLQPSDLDLFTRIAWEGYVSTATIVFVVSVVGCIGTRIRTVQTHTACGRFCTAVITHALTGIASNAAGTTSTGKASLDENMDIAVEAANVTIDLFSDEDFDATVYMPLGVHGKLQALLPALQQQVASFGKKRSPKKSHFIEVRDNMVGFLQYKQQHGCH